MGGADEKIVELSARKVVAVILGSLAVAGFGAWMISLDPEFIDAFRRFSSPAFVHGFGIFLVSFAGLGGLYGVRKLFGDRRGLVFNDAGVLDCTQEVSAGLIPWPEIVGVEIVKLPTQTVLAVKLKEPGKYLERQSPLKQALFMANYKLCGSPVALSVNLLKAKPAELLAHFSRYQQKYGNA
jgi:hypothetical protein